MLATFLKVLIVGVALSLDVFAVSIGVGVRGVSRRQKVRIGLTFASAETTMIVIGAGLGLAAGRIAGDYAGYVGFAGLVALGIFMMRESRAEMSEASRLDLSSGPGLLLAAVALSLDSLGVGFSVLYIGVPLPVSLIVIAIASVASTTTGLALGKALGGYAERNAAFFGGLLLSLTGVLFAVLKALRFG